MHIPIFVVVMRKESDLPFFKRTLMPLLAIAGSLFMIFAACFSHGMVVLAYLAVFGGGLLLELFFSRRNEVRESQP